MRTAIITARLSSSRVPGKVLDLTLPDTQLHLYKRLNDPSSTHLFSTIPYQLDHQLCQWADSVGQIFCWTVR